MMNNASTQGALALVEEIATVFAHAKQTSQTARAMGAHGVIAAELDHVVAKAEAHIDQITRERDKARASRLHHRGKRFAAEATITAQAAEIAGLKELYAREGHKALVVQENLSEAQAEITRLKAELAGKDAAIARKDAALRLVRGIIGDAAPTGFNCHDGDWAERLYASQGDTYTALNGPRAALTPSGAGEPVVKALVWSEPTKQSNDCWTADCILGTFSVAFEDGWYACLDDGRWEWEPENDPCSYEGPSAGQAACQSYLNRVVKAALSTGGDEPAQEGTR